MEVERYRQLVQSILKEYAAIPYSLGDLVCETVFDRENDKYLIVTLGRDLGKRVHFAVAHVDIINGKLWIQVDRTEDGIAVDLMNAGIPKEHIVLAFMSEERRRYTDFAVA